MARYGYGGKSKHVFRHEKTSLLGDCLRDGTLIVNVETGECFTMLGRYGRRLKEPAKIKTRIDEDGYEKFSLSRECKDKRRRPDSRGRRVRRQEVFVHKAVWMAKNGGVEIAPGVEVNHRKGPSNNWRNLELSTKEANSCHRAMTLEEQMKVYEFYASGEIKFNKEIGF